MPVTQMNKVYLTQGNTQTIALNGLQTTDQFGNVSFLDAASLTASLYDDQGNPVAGLVNVTLTYVPASNGNYTCTFGDDTFVPPEGTGYSLVITGNQNLSYIRLEIPVEVIARVF